MAVIGTSRCLHRAVLINITPILRCFAYNSIAMLKILRTLTLQFDDTSCFKDATCIPKITAL